MAPEMMKKIISKGKLYALYLWKKVRDSKIRTKLYMYLILTAVLCSLVIGGIGYSVMREVLVDNAEEAVVSLMKQVGNQLEVKVREFQEASFTLADQKDMKDIFVQSEKEMNKWNHTLNESIFNNHMFFYNTLYQNSDYAIMEADNEEVYIYNKVDTNQKINSEKSKELVEQLSKEVSKTMPVKWLELDDQIYFVRAVTQVKNNRIVEEIGTIAFAVEEEFFACGDDINPFISNDNLIVADADGTIYKNHNLDVQNLNIEQWLSYKDGRYYVYTVTSEVSGEKYLVIPLKTKREQWNVICFIPHTQIMEKANQVIQQVFVTMLILLCLGVLMANFIYKTIRKNLDIIERGMRQYEQGDYSRLESPAYYDEMGMLISQFSHMGLKIHELNELTRKEQEEKQNLKYQVLEAQINPHFLYNTLGSLKWMAYDREETEIAEMADAIIQLLRFTVKHANQFIRFEEEINYIQNYLHIQKSRYDDAFSTEFFITDEAKDFIVIGFILQPFVENSIYHGLDNARTDGLIRISGEVVSHKLHITVQDNGSGMTEDKLSELKNKIANEALEEYRGLNGIGIANIILRLKSVYGEVFQYDITSRPESGTTVDLVIPAKEYTHEEEGSDC